jgi:D-3-phosphoglycerate dehydrogenase
MKIAVLDDYQNAFRSVSVFGRLSAHEVTTFSDTVKDPLELARRLQGFDVVLLTQQRTALPRAAIERLTTVKLISQTGRNVNHVDVAACTERGIVVSAGGASSAYPTAELTWGLILSALRRIPQEVERLKNGQWQGSVGIGVNGKTLGVYAFGRIGSVVANVGRAFGMRVLCWGREGSLGRAREAGFEIAASREAFFESCDVVCLHIPLNPQTRGIVTLADLQRMKPQALIVNTSRAGIIQSGALIAALDAGRPGLAAVDVYDEEPVLGATDPLLRRDNVVCTPHLGYVEKGAYEVLFGMAIDQILAFAAGKPINVVNDK